MTIPESIHAPRTLYTPEKANKALPLVRAIVSDIVRQWGVVCKLEERLSPLLRQDRRGTQSSMHEEELDHCETQMKAEQEKLRGYLLELEKLGVEIKSIEDGLCDFPCQMDGREVFLCWRLGESSVSHWHEVDAGFAGRRPLPQ